MTNICHWYQGWIVLKNWVSSGIVEETRKIGILSSFFHFLKNKYRKPGLKPEETWGKKYNTNFQLYKCLVEETMAHDYLLE